MSENQKIQILLTCNNNIPRDIKHQFLTDCKQKQRAYVRSKYNKVSFDTNNFFNYFKNDANIDNSNYSDDQLVNLVLVHMNENFASFNMVKDPAVRESFYVTLTAFFEWLGQRYIYKITNRQHLIRCVGSYYPKCCDPTLYIPWLKDQISAAQKMISKHNDAFPNEKIAEISDFEQCDIIRRIFYEMNNDERYGNNSKINESIKKEMEKITFNTVAEFEGLCQSIKDKARPQVLQNKRKWTIFYPTQAENSLTVTKQSAFDKKRKRSNSDHNNRHNRNHRDRHNRDGQNRKNDRNKRDRNQRKRSLQQSGGSHDDRGDAKRQRKSKKYRFSACKKGKNCHFNKKGNCRDWHPRDPRKRCYKKNNCHRLVTGTCSYEHSPQEIEQSKKASMNSKEFSTKNQKIEHYNPVKSLTNKIAQSELYKHQKNRNSQSQSLHILDDSGDETLCTMDDKAQQIVLAMAEENRILAEHNKRLMAEMNTDHGQSQRPQRASTNPRSINIQINGRKKKVTFSDFTKTKTG